MSEGQPYHYSAEDIRNYLEGRMSGAQMHALEKAALDDPFLAAALEGFQTSGVDLGSDMDLLRTKLQEKTDHSKERKPIVGWLTVASAAALVLSLSFGAWLMFSPGEQSQIAKTETVKSEGGPHQEPVTSSVNDTAQRPTQHPAVDSKVKGEPQIIPTPPPSDRSAAEESRAKAEEPPIAAVADPVAVPPADVSSASSPAVESKAAPRAGRAKSMVGTLERGAQPVEGWVAFDTYLKKNLRQPLGPSAGIHGTVTVSFLINRENGKPYDFKIERSLHPDYDAEAIRVLRDGPLWQPAPADKNAPPAGSTTKAFRTIYIIEF